jgi:hypothetical protein
VRTPAHESFQPLGGRVDCVSACQHRVHQFEATVNVPSVFTERYGMPKVILCVSPIRSGDGDFRQAYAV